MLDLGPIISYAATFFRLRSNVAYSKSTKKIIVKIIFFLASIEMLVLNFRIGLIE